MEVVALVYSIIKDIGLCLWNFVSSPVDIVRNLERNLDSLNDAMERLNISYHDVKERVKREELPRMRCTKEVVSWFAGVEKMMKDVTETLQVNREDAKVLGGCCPKNCLSDYKLGKRVSELLNKIEKLRTDARFVSVVGGVHIPVYEMPEEETVGLGPVSQAVWRCIEDETIGIIGLCGIGGIGKTTLLKRINNMFLEKSHDFYWVIFVTVSKHAEKKEIQETILKGMNMPTGTVSSSVEMNSWIICERLRSNKFVLLLDDVWDRLNLSEIGVPLPVNRNKSKVIFTTRSEDVCGQMGAHRTIEVQCLTTEDASRLFQKKIGEDTLNSDPKIPEFAEIMAAECEGLPLALVTVGGAMASKKNRAYWEHEMDVFRRAPSRFQGMEAVLGRLKFSFERLQNPTLESCFLYCCLFPESSNIRNEELIEYWKAEGFLNEEKNYRRYGENIIGSLKRGSLLENGESEEFVKMHSMIHEMARLECGAKVAILSKKAGGLRWNEVERISLWDYSIEDLTYKKKNSIEDLLEEAYRPSSSASGDDDRKRLSNLRTLICRLPMLTTFPTRFLPSMHGLRLLDLSRSYLLHELPEEIGELINLEYLNISETPLTQLPPQLGNLTKLMCFILNNTTSLRFDRGMISRLQALEIYSRMGRNDYCIDCDTYLLGELEGLTHLREICIVILNTAYAKKLFGSKMLQRCLRKLYLSIQDGLPSLEVSPTFLSTTMEHLELYDCTQLREVTFPPRTNLSWEKSFNNLCTVVIGELPSLLNVTWLKYTPKLQTLDIHHCESMVEIIGDNEIEEEQGTFSTLKILHLKDLPKLESICRHVLPFPSLLEMEVAECDHLMQLPFDCNSAKNSLKRIRCNERWWHRLRWRDEDVQQAFSSKFATYEIGECSED